MKKLLIACLVVFLVAGVVFAQQARYKNGTFTGTAKGFDSKVMERNGSITVSVVIKSAKIDKIEVKDHTDTKMFLNMVEKSMIPAMISANNADVDAVAGATFSSEGFKEAVADALVKAKR